MAPLVSFIPWTCSILGFAYMTNQLMALADGKVILVLEGGYELNALAQCGKACVEVLLGRPVSVTRLVADIHSVLLSL